jgi:hypothetical protein
MWLPAYLPDVESDLSAFHRVDHIDQLSAPRFFQLAWRLPHYRGVMRDRVIALQGEQEAPRESAGRPAPRTSARAAQPEPVTEAVLGDPVMGRIFDFS